MKRRIAPVVLVLYFLAFVFIVIVLGYFWQKHRETPEQPINFSHQLHISKVGLECKFCHNTVDKSRFAGIPSVQKCMSCHQAVATDRPEIKKLTKFWEEKKPVPWKRVYKLPQRKYVYFSHERHIKADLECVNCHGEVKVMPVIKRVRKMEMGWCISCHRANNASIDCATCHK